MRASNNTELASQFVRDALNEALSKSIKELMQKFELTADEAVGVIAVTCGKVMATNIGVFMSLPAAAIVELSDEIDATVLKWLADHQPPANG